MKKLKTVTGKSTGELAKKPKSYLTSIFNKERYQFEGAFLRRILCLFVQDNDFLRSYRRLVEPRFFEREDHFTVANAIAEHYDENLKPPSRTLLRHRLGLDQTGGDDQNRPAVEKLVNLIYKIDITQDAETIRNSILRFGNTQARKAAMRKCARFNAEAQFDEADRVMAEAAAICRDQQETGVFHDESIEFRIKWRKERLTNAVSTGMPAFDEQMGGGMYPGWVIVLMAGTNVGKTTGCVNMAYGACASGKNVLYVSTEIKAKTWVGDKLDARMALIPSSELEEKEELLRERLKRFYSKTAAKIDLLWAEPYTTTVTELRAYYQERKRASSWKADLVVIDSPDLLKALGRHQEEHERLKEIWTSIYAWAGKDEIPILVTSDVQKDKARKKLLVRTDVGGAYEKMKKADVVICCGQDDELRAVEDGRNKIWANFDKVRLAGMAGKVIEVECHGATSTWTAARVLEDYELRDRASIG